MVIPKQAKGDLIMGCGFCFNVDFLIAHPLNFLICQKFSSSIVKYSKALG